VAVTLEGTANI
jgi:hypothetical protein